jgi:hypothetical protein
MTRLFAITVAALALGLVPAMAMENSSQNRPPTASTVSPDASKSATIPQSGSADTSGGAAEQSSSPPLAGSTTSNKMGAQGSSQSSQTTPNPTAPSSND